MKELDTGIEGAGTRTVVLELDGVQWATQKNVVETVLGGDRELLAPRLIRSLRP